MPFLTLQSRSTRSRYRRARAVWPGRPRRVIVGSPKDCTRVEPCATRRSTIVDQASHEPGPGVAAGPESGPAAGTEAASRPAGPPTVDSVPRWAWGAFGLLFAMH